MTKELGWAVFSLLLMSSLAGCSKVEKCEKGSEGCLGGAPLDDDTCNAGLVVGEDGTCVEPSGDGEGGYCDEASQVPERQPVPPPCEPPESTDDDPMRYDFAEVCKRKCLQTCMRAEIMCTDYECNPSECDSPTVLASCVVECPDMDEDCLTESCQQVQYASCAGFACPADTGHDCGDVRCSDTCTENKQDGYCDDGHPFSAAYSLCVHGTDCSDCGPRQGDRPARARLGGLCAGGRDVACEGYEDDYLSNGAFCVHVAGTPDGQFRCVPDCTSDDEVCPDGFDCEDLEFTSGAPYTDLSGVQGRACFPNFCQ
jgi:hypothetical protein